MTSTERARVIEVLREAEDFMACCRPNETDGYRWGLISRLKRRGKITSELRRHELSPLYCV